MKEKKAVNSHEWTGFSSSSRALFFQAEDGIRDLYGLEFRRVLFRSHLAGHWLVEPHGDGLSVCQQLSAAGNRAHGRCGGRVRLQTTHLFEIGRASCRERV